jgi:hypothetical protein
MKTTIHTYTVGRASFTPYRKFPPDFPTAPTSIQLAELYDKAAKRIKKLEEALKLCAPLTQRAIDARSEALDPDLQ